MKVLRKHINLIVYSFIADILLGILFPSIGSLYALTSGPNSPEFSSFEPVATTNLVDPFSGSFAYNLPVIQIPGPDGGGYAMSLSYHSGTTSEEDASWVGHGWTLNPGAINKNVRGIPDEYNNTPIDYYNKTRPNWTMSGSEKLNLEVFSQSKESTPENPKYNSQSPLGVGKHVRFNNYIGLSRTNTLRLSKGFGSLSMNRSATGITFSAAINPFAFFDKVDLAQEEKKDKNFIRLNKKNEDENRVKRSLKSSARATAANSIYNLPMYSDLGRPVNLSKVKGYNFNVSFGAQTNPSVAPVGIEGGLEGSFSVNRTKAKETISAYGYLNTPSGIGSYRSDYFTEKAQPFDRRDYFIGIPFSTPDMYSLTGEGLSGGFRAYRPSSGFYHPERIDGDENKIRTYGLGIEFMFGGNLGIGVNLAFGNNTSKMRDWNRDGNTNNESFSFDSDDTFMYRFFGDLGGEVSYGTNQLSKALLKAEPNFPGVTSVFPSLSSSEIQDLDKEKATTSSFIEKESEGFNIVNEAGLSYHYDLDTQVKNATNISIDVNENDQIESNYLAFKKLYLNDQFDVDACLHNVVLGDVKKEPYTVTSLLKSITTSDYIDVGNNGPDAMDFGGWTSFEYYKKYGNSNDMGNSNWYRWRIPYNGLLYQKNSISDVKDDLGYVSSGEKEVFYLKKVETKTHIAYFVTNKSTPERFDVTSGDPKYTFLNGSNVDRLDGLAAGSLTASEDPSADNASAKDELSKLEYLERVVLFAKDQPEAPLQITNFQYDYTLVGNTPNNLNGKFPANAQLPNSGKLTLRKVWSEFEGVYNARISSYKFDYRYKDKNDFPNYLIDENPALTDFFDLSSTYSVNAQNPNYGPYLLDAWGYNQFDGKSRHLNLRSWPYQGDIAAGAYDPAAWQLKQITLPSGGQILVQYENKDYNYVQDRDVMALVKLKNFVDDYESPRYTLDLSDIGYDIEEDAVAIQELYNKLRAHFLGDGNTDTTDETIKNRIYFKLLYALEGNYSDIENCKSEYITGYAKVKDVLLDTETGEISIELNGASDGKNLVGVGIYDEPIEDEGYRLTPRQACYDFYTTQRWGKYTAGCESKLERQYEEDVLELVGCDKPLVDNVGDALKIGQFTLNGMTTVSGMVVNSKFPKKMEVCKTLNPELSYLKIPMNKAKRGGGIRVKRLLMYDKGIETGDAAVYGQNYNYVLEDGRSSGVATNEPNTMREENPLVGFLPKKDQSWLNRLIVGKDREQSEGPIGESLLPGPSVSHSRVVVENIHTGKTGSGHSIYEYYTCKDYPFDKLYDYSQNGTGSDTKYDIGEAGPVKGVEYSNLQENSFDDKLNIPSPNFQYSLDKSWASQGFRFILNNMHGQPKSVRTYGGSYQEGLSSYISSGQDFYYYEPGEKIRLLKEDGTIIWDVPGKEMDVSMEKYQIKNQNLDFNFEIDVSVGLIFPPPIFASGWLGFSYSDQRLNKIAVSKVITYPAIQKKVVSYSDNIASTSENLGFDYATGRSVLTKTYDAYHGIPLHSSEEVHNGSIYSLNIPAHWNYMAMGRKSENISNTNQLLASSGNIISYGESANFINTDDTWSIKDDRIISASATTYNTLANVTQWMDENIHTVYNSSTSQEELQNIWRTHQSYVYKDDVSESSNRNTESGKIYEGGILKSFVPFNYGLQQQEDKWVALNEVTKYSPNGNPLEERDVLGIYSASKYGYGFTQPVVVSKNAQYSEIYFEHFEDKYDPGSGSSDIVYGIAHSGNYSKKINNNASLLNDVVAKETLSNEGGWLKFWIKSNGELQDAILTINGDEYRPERVAITGEWSLYNVFVEPISMDMDQAVTTQFNYANVGDIYIDDIKFNPKESQSSCFVYDAKSLRLLTLFDDQHFGLYYQYNNEGQLIRKLIETERGLKVITETQYNTPKQARENL